MRIVSNARKLIFRPEANATVVEFPSNATINEWGVNGKNPSVIVLNGTEEKPTWQGVDHASGVVIVNEVPEELANAALEIFEQGNKTNEALRVALYFLASNGCVDQYTCGLDFVEGKLSPAGRMVDDHTGVVKRDDRDLTLVWREGEVFYAAPNNEARVIESDILLRTYRNADGTEINLDDIPEGRPEEISE